LFLVRLYFSDKNNAFIFIFVTIILCTYCFTPLAAELSNFSAKIAALLHNKLQISFQGGIDKIESKIVAVSGLKLHKIFQNKKF